MEMVVVRLGMFPVNRSERQPEARPLQAADVCKGSESLPNNKKPPQGGVHRGDGFSAGFW